MRFDEMKSDYKPSEKKDGDYPDVPAGKYTVQIARAEVKESGNSKWLNVGFKIVGGDFDKQWIWHAFFIFSGSDKSVAFQRKKFFELCDAVGKLKFSGDVATPTIASPADLAKVSTELSVVYELDDYKMEHRAPDDTNTYYRIAWFNKVEQKKPARASSGANEYATSPSEFASGNENLPF